MAFFSIFFLLLCVNNDSILISLPQRSSHTFKQVLSYLNDNLHPYPKNLAYELDFYDIEYDINKLYDSDDFPNKYEIRRCSHFDRKHEFRETYWGTKLKQCTNNFLAFKDDNEKKCIIHQK